MAKEDRKLTSEERRDLVVYDDQSREILRLGETISESEGDDGEDFCQTDTEGIIGSDGTFTSFQSLMRPPNQGGVTLKRCDICWLKACRAILRRNRNRNQFAPATNIRRCYRCSKNLCSHHARVFDKHIVCSRCRILQFILHRILKPIFFKRVRKT